MTMEKNIQEKINLISFLFKYFLIGFLGIVLFPIWVPVMLIIFIGIAITDSWFDEKN